MVQFVTVPGGTGTTITIPFTSGTDATAAAALLSGVYYAALGQRNIERTSAIVTPAIPNDANLLIDDVQGIQGVPNGYTTLVAGYLINSTDTYPTTSFVAGGNLSSAVINIEQTRTYFQAGTGNTTIVAGGNTVLSTLAQSGGAVTALLDGNGATSGVLTTGDWTLTTGTGTGDFTLGSGNDTIVANGADTIRGGSGPATITLNGVRDVVYGGGSPETIVDNGSSDTIYAGSGTETVFGTGTNLTVLGGSGEVQFIAGISAPSNNAVYGSNGGLVIFGGAGGGFYTAPTGYMLFVSEGGRDTISAAAGEAAPVIFGYANAQVELQSETRGSFLVAGQGNETLNGGPSSSSLTFFAGPGNVDMIGGSAADFMAASTGDATMAGGAGGNLYDFISGHAGGTDLILGFNSGDLLYLTSYANGGIIQEQVLNGSVVMTLNDGTHITFQGVSDTNFLNTRIFHN